MNVTSNLFPNLKNRAPSMAAILEAALVSADPQSVVIKALRTLQNEIDFSSYKRVGLVAMGKAAVPMAQAALKSLGRFVQSGIVVSKVMPEDGHALLPGLKLIKGNHPVPGDDSVIAGEDIIQYVEGFDDRDIVLFLISGGASALVTHPVYAIELNELMTVTSLLLGCGASIDEINAVRKHLDDIKGGGLAVYTAPAACVSLVLSDVPGDRLDVIASGPTVPDSTTFSDALAVLEKYQLSEKVPEAVLSFLVDGARGIVLENPKPGTPIFSGNRAIIIGSIGMAMQAAKAAAEQSGYVTEIMTPLVTGEASTQGARLAGFLRQQALLRKPGDLPRCWIAGGETTVTLTGNGSGGRNQELALAAVNELDGIDGAMLVTFATDGEDGQSPAAGAIVTGTTRKMAREKGLDPSIYLANHNSFPFFKAMDTALITGSTGTNVNDLVVMLLD